MLLSPDTVTGLKLVRVQLHGSRPCLSRGVSAARSIASERHGNITTWVVPPSKPTDPGVGSISPRTGRIDEDGALLPNIPRSVIVGQSRDCPLVTLENRDSGLVALVHAGRHSLLKGVLANALTAIRHEPGRGRTHAFVTAGIRAAHFRHERNPSLVRPFTRRYGDSVVTDRHWLTLDLFAVIRLELSRAGVLPHHIRDDGLCTHCHKKLGSKRADDAGITGNTLPNYVLVQRAN